MIFDNEIRKTFVHCTGTIHNNCGVRENSRIIFQISCDSRNFTFHPTKNTKSVNYRCLRLGHEVYTFMLERSILQSTGSEMENHNVETIIATVYCDCVKI